MHGRGADFLRQTCAQGGLTGWSLPLTRLQDIAHDDFINLVGLKTCTLDSSLNGNSTQLVGGL